jgi:hypothetical protein
MSTVLRRSSILLVALIIVVTLVPSAAVAADEVIDVDSSEDPGVLDDATIEYDGDNGEIRFNITFHKDNDPMSSNITDIYVDTGNPEGINDETFADSGGETAKFWENLGDLDADYRIAIGDGTNVVEPWDEETSQFDGSNSAKIEIVEQKDSYVVVRVDEEDIGAPDTIDYKFAYIDGDGIEDESSYTWAPDSSLRRNLEEGETVNTGVINATINVSDTPINDDAEIVISTSDGQEQNQEDIEVDGNSNISAEFTVDESDFSGDGDVTAEINGENYTLDNTRAVTVSEGSTKDVVFEPHRLIEVSDEVTGENEDYTVELRDNDGNTIDAEAVFNEDSYNFSGVNATKLVNGGEVEASLDDETSLNSISPQSQTIDSVDRYNPNDIVNEGNKFDIKPPTERINIKTNISEANISDTSQFNLTVNASADGDDRVDAVKHVLEFNPDQIVYEDTEYQIITDNQNRTDIEGSEEGEEDQIETVIVNASGGPVISEGSEDVTLFNMTFRFESEFEPDQSGSANTENSEIVELETVTDTADIEGSRLINSTDSKISTDLNEDDVKGLKFETDTTEVDVFNPETVIEFEQADVDHLTSGGDMVGAPVRFEVEAGSNEGEISKIVLNNTRNGEVPDESSDESQFIDCEGLSTCDGTLAHVPQDDTFIDNSSYATKSVYDITVVPVNDASRGVIGDNKTVTDPRDGGGEEIYKRGDVTGITGNDKGNVTLGGDVESILDKRGTEPIGTDEESRHDVNNDGVIDLVDVTIVAQEYEPP